MLRTLLVIIVVLLLLRAIARLFRGVMEGASASPRRTAGGPPPVKMVPDPVCGTFVVPGKALQLARGGETHYFCSTGCRDKWQASH
jgi:YHS domain-containing protein